MTTKLTEEDRNLLLYFHEHGDITRWSQWESKKALFIVEYPELISAMFSLNVAERTLDAVVLRIGNESGE